MDENTLHLKKYANRRLYDTAKSVYVTLDYVTDAIRQGRQIQVTDAKTGEDVTPAILTQIVLEEARKNKYLLPSPLLYLIIYLPLHIRREFGVDVGQGLYLGHGRELAAPGRKGVYAHVAATLPGCGDGPGKCGIVDVSCSDECFPHVSPLFAA